VTGVAPLIHVGNPDLEREGANLEREAGNHETMPALARKLCGLAARNGRAAHTQALHRVREQKGIPRHAIKQRDSKSSSAELRRHDKYLRPASSVSALVRE